ncbi:hypothetical protein NUW54_g3864 [Trametes sanguinea]|uniref:Uncharacterized protein n=1 Tax=Trametes sanguinea TaxID=158606 RepID=A0ACC1Q050_9APHY|nr:hypothetical protein NUW54_g3864 [Trametes sanguinea]
MMTTVERLKRSLPDALQSQSLCAPYYGLLPCSKLSKSDDLSSRTRESLLAEALEYERTILSLSALLNASAPVNLLPDDVLVKIFAKARANRYGRTHRSWTELSLVCRHWFVVIAAAPTCASIGPPARIHCILQHTGAVALLCSAIEYDTPQIAYTFQRTGAHACSSPI